VPQHLTFGWVIVGIILISMDFRLHIYFKSARKSQVDEPDMLFANNVCIFDFGGKRIKKKIFIGADMKKISVMIAIASLFLKTGNCNLMACTIFNATQSGITLVGNNEDGTDPITYVWFLPAEKSKYGRVYFGLSDKWPQGGMNDQGLFYDGTACPLLEVKKSEGKPIYNGNLSEKILEECSTVDEALELLGKYNLNYFRNGEMMIVDKFGSSVIV
jgi:hypothetical protein